MYRSPVQPFFHEINQPRNGAPFVSGSFHQFPLKTSVQMDVERILGTRKPAVKPVASDAWIIPDDELESLQAQQDRMRAVLEHIATEGLNSTMVLTAKDLSEIKADYERRRQEFEFQELLPLGKATPQPPKTYSPWVMENRKKYAIQKQMELREKRLAIAEAARILSIQNQPEEPEKEIGRALTHAERADVQFESDLHRQRQRQFFDS